MRLYPEQLQANLQQGLRQSYLLFGNDPLFKQESIQRIQKEARWQGFDEIYRFELDSKLDWQEIYDACQSLSLFSDKKILQLFMPESGINVTLANQLKKLTPMLHADILLILVGPRLNQKQEASQWFTAFKQQGVYIACNTPELGQLKNLIKVRCKELALFPDDDALELLALWHEGNLLALVQSLAKLQLLYPEGKISKAEVEEALSPYSHFSPFALIDALIEAKAERAILILRQLEAEGVELTLLLRLIQKELIQLYKMQESLQSGMALGNLFDGFRIWQQKRVAYANALNRLETLKLIQLLEHLSKLEIMVKMHSSADHWLEFTDFCLKLCGISSAKAR